MCEYHQWRRTFILNLSTLGLRVLELFAMCATDGLTKATLTAPFPTGRGIGCQTEALSTTVDMMKTTLSVPLWGDRYQNARSNLRDRPPLLGKLLVKSVQHFQRRCVPNRQTDRQSRDRQTDRQTDTHTYCKVNISHYRG